MSEELERDEGTEAVDLANSLEKVLRGHSRVAAYLALGMVIGAQISDAENPDLDGTMALIRKVAADELRRRLE